MPPEQQPSLPAQPGGQPHWTQYAIIVLLAVCAVGLWNRTERLIPTATAQDGRAGARGVYAFTGPLDQNTAGLFMMDVDQGTLWVYALEPEGGTRRLQLVAARTWVYDRYLQDFNCAAPDFREVQKLVAKQRNQDRDATPGSSTDRGSD